MKSRDDKAKDLEALRKELEQSPAIFVTGYEKMTVQQDYELRKTVRGAGGSYKVIKNNIADKASEGLGVQRCIRQSEGNDFDRLDNGRSGCAGEGAHDIRQNEPERLRSRPASSKAASSRSRTSRNWRACRPRKS